MKALARNLVGSHHPDGRPMTDEDLLRALHERGSRQTAAYGGKGPEERSRTPERIAELEENIKRLSEAGYHNREMSIDILDRQCDNNFERALTFYRSLPANEVAALNPGTQSGPPSPPPARTPPLDAPRHEGLAGMPPDAMAAIFKTASEYPPQPAVKPKPSEAAPAMTSSLTGGVQCLEPGTTVKVVGIKSKPELNGQHGVVERFVSKSQRYAVRVNDKRFQFKRVNLQI